MICRLGLGSGNAVVLDLQRRNHVEALESSLLQKAQRLAVPVYLLYNRIGRSLWVRDAKAQRGWSWGHGLLRYRLNREIEALGINHEDHQRDHIL